MAQWPSVAFRTVSWPLESALSSVYAVIACLLGNLFATVIYVARVNTISPFDVLTNTPTSDLARSIASDMQFGDLIFWIVTIGAAAYFAKRRLSREEGLAPHMFELKH